MNTKEAIESLTDDEAKAFHALVAGALSFYCEDTPLGLMGRGEGIKLNDKDAEQFGLSERLQALNNKGLIRGISMDVCLDQETSFIHMDDCWDELTKRAERWGRPVEHTTKILCDEVEDIAEVKCGSYKYRVAYKFVDQDAEECLAGFNQWVDTCKFMKGLLTDGYEIVGVYGG